MSRWLAFPAHHAAAFRQAGIGGRAVERANPQFWLAPERPDHALDDEPALPFLLSEEEIDELRDERLAAATHFGPVAQDKASNEDFAVTAVIDLGPDRVFGFAALADGVTTRTFWSGRAARIACLGAYRAFRALLGAGFDPGDENKASRASTAVARMIGRCLSRDYANLERAKAVPAGWDPDTYQRYKHDLTLWYRSTLLFGLVGPTGGLIGFSGDGGIRGLIVSDEATARDPVERRIFHSIEGVPLSAYVSFGFDPNEITLRRITSEGRDATHVLFASDGVDKALQAFEPNLVEEGGARCRSRWRDLPLDNRSEAFDFLEAFARHPHVAAEPDNLSVARLSWPLPEPGASWATWRQEPLERWRVAGEKPMLPNRSAINTPRRLA